MDGSMEEVDVEQALDQAFQGSSNTTPIFVCAPAAMEVPRYTAAVMQVAGKNQADCVVLDLRLETETAVLERLELESTQGEWVLLLNAQQVSPETLRTIALSVFNRNVTELSFRFRLWVMHIGDVDPNDTSHFPSPMLVPALIALCSGKVASKHSLIADQVEASVDKNTGADIFWLQEQLYGGEKTVETLTLTEGHMPHILELMEAVKVSSSCRRLILEDCGVGPVEAAYIATMLKANSKLQRLELVQCCLTDDCVAELCLGLQRNTSLQLLDLSRNPSIQDAGVHLLAELLHPTSGCRLQQLIFQMNNSIRHHYALGFHCSSVRHLCRSLRVNTCLTTLNLCNTKLTNRCVQSLAKALKRNKTLLSLTVADNRVGDEAGVALADALSGRNKTLTELDMSSTGISVITVCAFAQVLKANFALKTLRFSENRIVQLPEPQHLSNTVFDDHDDCVADPGELESSEDEDGAEADKAAPVFAPEDEDEEDLEALEDISSIALQRTAQASHDATASRYDVTQAMPLPQEMAEQAIETIAQRYDRFEGIQSLTDVLQSNNALTELYLDNCCLCDKTLKIIVDGLLLGNNRSLHKLTLSKNDAFGEKASMLIKDLIISSHSVDDIAVGTTHPSVAERALLAIEQTSVLKRLDVSWNDLGQDMVQTLHDSVERNARCSLEALVLTGNTMNEQSVLIMGRMLPMPHLRLTFLDMGSCLRLTEYEDMGCKLMQSFGKALAQAQHLRELLFYDNGMTDAAAAIFMKMLKQSRTLNTVDVSFNHILTTSRSLAAVADHFTVRAIRQQPFVPKP